MNNKKGQILTETVMFIVLNVIFLIILGAWVAKQGNGAILLEQSYAKNIALLIDAAKPVTEMTLDMEDAFNLARKNRVERKDIVTIQGNYVQVKLSLEGGYKYYFFNDVDATAYPDVSSTNNYIIKINKYNK